MYKIRLARENDLNFLVNLDKITSVTPWTMLNYASSFKNSQHKIYILENAGQISGALVLGLSLDEGEILQFWIKKEQQNKGWGRILLQHALAFMQHHQVQSTFLEVRSDNINAIKLYEKLGFLQVGLRQDYYQVDGWRFDAIVMQKNLCIFKCLFALRNKI